MTKTSDHNQRGRAVPLCVRVSASERVALVRAAGDRSISDYVRERLFVDADDGLDCTSDGVRKRRAARLLCELGKSEISRSLGALADAAVRGALVLDDDLKAELQAALADVHAMRLELLRALGLRPGGRS